MESLEKQKPDFEPVYVVDFESDNKVTSNCPVTATESTGGSKSCAKKVFDKGNMLSNVITHK